MSALSSDVAVAVVGAGSMGRGIAQVAAQAGHEVALFDSQDGAARRGRDQVAADLDRLVARGRLDAEDARAVLGRMRPVDRLDGIGDAGLVIEAIVEDLATKRDLVRAVEGLVGPGTIFATNTSSLLVTAIAAAAARPERVVGMHFFNPAPVMRLVEVVAGAASDPGAVETVLETARAWGKIAVGVRDTPAFIVNRVARPYYGESLRLLEEGLADIATMDAVMRESGGFRMGPFTLLDLVGNDVNAAVTRSVFDAFFQDPRYRPSLLQNAYVAAGWLGRKSGRGFYDYRDGAEPPQPRTEPAADASAAPVEPDFAGAEQGIAGVRFAMTDGRTAAERERVTGTPWVVHDLACPDLPGRRLAITLSPGVPEEARRAIVGGLQAAGWAVSRFADRPGLLVARTVAMLANEAFEASLLGVAAERDIDLAMQHGVNYPQGPAAWARDIGLARVRDLLDAVHAATGDPRYRVSLGLRLAADAEAVARRGE